MHIPVTTNFKDYHLFNVQVVSEGAAVNTSEMFKPLVDNVTSKVGFRVQFGFWQA